ncbi:hypothetical protein GE21DRAFT_1217071, partial [Neurospora crassa]
VGSDSSRQREGGRVTYTTSPCPSELTQRHSLVRVKRRINQYMLIALDEYLVYMEKTKLRSKVGGNRHSGCA